MFKSSQGAGVLGFGAVKTAGDTCTFARRHPPVRAPRSLGRTASGAYNFRFNAVHPRARCAHPQPQEPQPRSAARAADRGHRTVRLGKVLADLRHALRRGPAPLRGIAVRLRAAVPVHHGQARRRQHRGALAGDRHRAEGELAQPALDRRHGDRDLRLPASAVRARRHPALSRSRHRAHRADSEPDGRPGAARCPRARPRRSSPRSCSDRKGEHLELLEDLASQGFVRVRIDGRDLRHGGAAEARSEEEAHHRGGGGPYARAARRRAAPGRILRDRAAPLRRARAPGVPR